MRIWTHISQQTRRFAACECGAALVEFAIVLPILILFFAMTIEGGRMMWSYQTAAAGVRDAVRYVSRVAPVDICTTGGSLAGYASELQDMVETSISGSYIYPGGVTINSVTPTYVCVTGSYRNSPVAVARVTADITIDFPFGALFGYATGSALTGLNATLFDENRIFGI